MELAVAAAEGEGLRGRHPGQPVALDARPGVVRERIGNEGDARLQHVDLDAVAAAGPLAIVKSAEDAVAREHAGGVVGDGRPARLRMLRVELQAEDAAQRHRHIIVGRPLAVGPGFAEPGDRAMDQPGIGGLERLLPQSELGHDAGPIILEQDVGAGEELEQDGTARLRAQVELDAALAAVVGDEIRAVLPAAEIAERIAALRMLDLDHVGAEIGEHHAGERRRDHRAQLDHVHALEDIGH